MLSRLWLFTATTRLPRLTTSRLPVCLSSACACACACVAAQVRFHMDLFTVIKANTDKLVKPKRAKKKPNKAA